MSHPTSTTSSSATTTASPNSITLNIFSLNCWGLKYISKYRHERLTEISRRIAVATPLYDIVALQEFWVYEDYLTLRSITQNVLPYGKFFHSGVLGGGLVVLSRYPIVGSGMSGYTLNGRPTAFWRGDWYVGKGVASAMIEVEGRVVEVFNTHLHAPYEAGDDSYLCHRTAQAWQISKMMRSAVQKGHIPLGLGDFNMIPSSLAHHIITTHGLVSDSWLSKYPTTAASPSASRTASYNIETLGITCDSMLNTWRMPRNSPTIPSPEAKDPRAKRLDYIFHSPRMSRVLDIRVGCTEPMKLGPGVRAKKPSHGVTKDGLVSLSDHFSVELVLEIPPLPQPPLITFGDDENDDDDENVVDVNGKKHNLLRSNNKNLHAGDEGHEEKYLSLETITEIQELSRRYTQREEWEYTWRIAHFWASVLVLVGLHVAVWWTGAYPGVAFLLLFLAWAVAVTGTINGLIGFLFMGSELNALKEFDEEIRFYKRIVERKLSDGTGSVMGRVNGGMGGRLSTSRRIEGERELEARSVEIDQGVMRP
ncbi:Endonuclease/exonuclease/phosphatase [Peziza echinospora]|nr:Endonuclease/exonuclease/phosphatase [Peziza echinospora]